MTYRSLFLAIAIGLTGVHHAAGQQACTPRLVLKDVHFSEMQPPTLERKWTATVSVDASRCAADAEGSFDIAFTRLKEYGVDLELRERFQWRPPEVKIAIDFWADEAPAHTRMDNVAPCRCAD
jgi:hypothetical protein